MVWLMPSWIKVKFLEGEIRVTPQSEISSKWLKSLLNEWNIYKTSEISI